MALKETTTLQTKVCPPPMAVNNRLDQMILLRKLSLIGDGFVLLEKKELCIAQAISYIAKDQGLP